MDKNQREESALLRLNHYSILQLIKLYWQSDQKFWAYSFCAAALVMTIVLVGFDVVFNYWYNYFYNALQAYDARTTVRLLFVFCGLAFVNIVIAVYRYYISQLFGLRWRKWLTDQFLNRWLEGRSYYYLENFDEKTDNPEQRIQEDIAALVSSSISLTIGMVSAVTTLIAFIIILWQLSGIFQVNLGPLGEWHIPGYLLWVALIYSFIGTYLTHIIGRPLVFLNFEQQRREANFRFAAMDLRSHAEDVALYRGENHQKNILEKIFGGVLANWLAIILRQKKLLWFTAGYNQLSVLIPFIFVLPNYFQKVFLLGGLMQSVRAFGSVQDSLSFIINSYTQIAEWQAISQRLTTFANHMTEADQKADEENKLVVNESEKNSIDARGVTIKTPRGEGLLSNVNEEFVHGNNYLIKGVSGIGKSTFVRTLAGIWPYASGDVSFPANKKIMYLPQKPYMPIGTLSEAILFPDKEHPEMEMKLQDVLRACHLEQFIPRLQETAAWSEQLSPGEQQRIAFARVLLHRPDWVFLDESTSMLDVANETHLYKMLKSKLPDCSIVSIGHRPTIDAFHDHIINISKYKAELAT